MRQTGHDAGRGLSAAQIGRVALHARARLGIDSHGKVQGLDLLHRLSRFTVGGRSVAYHVDNLRDGAEAETRYLAKNDEFEIALALDTYTGVAEHDDPRDLFTLAHEVGHLVLHPSLLVKLQQIPRPIAALMRRGNEVPIYRCAEWQADTFSSLFLATTDGVRQLASQRPVSSGALSAFFGLSGAAGEARMRLYERGL